MKLVVDANPIFSALIKGEFTLSFIFWLKQSGFELFTCREVFDEIEGNKPTILRYSQFSSEGIDFILELILDVVGVFKKDEYGKFLPEADKFCSDKDDLPYVALSLMLNRVSIWSNDKRLKEELSKAGIKVFSTQELKELVGL
jgi:predicted nucleic acid-binding protein